ncbi:hypothetical protein [Streptomyces chartreusis]|uniref:hypothetical protein n=1 Tax=Streptomyces chartreusis TaxID=1969 RepID=UPI0038031FC4
MNTMSVQLPEGELTFEQDVQMVMSNLPVPDPCWRLTDEQGHEHHYASGPDRYPTLTAKQGDVYWCEDCRDEHQDSWYVCRTCGERITPGTRIDTTPRWLGGPALYYLNGKPISQERANELLTR